MVKINRNENRFTGLLSALGMLLLCTVSFAQEGNDKSKDSTLGGTIRYNPDNGFEFKTRDNRFMMQIRSRLQFRFSTPEDQDPVTFDDFSGEKEPGFKINRARIKVGGHAFKPWLKYSWEYELSQSNLLNYTKNLQAC